MESDTQRHRHWLRRAHGHTLSLQAARWSTVPFLLVGVMLLGSVLIPARQTWRIMQLLRETTEVIEPARVLGARLEYGLTVEAGALEGFALSGDSVLLARYVAAAVDDNRRLASLEALARRLDPEAADRAAGVRSRLDEWRVMSRAPAGASAPQPDLAATRTRQASYQAVLREVGRLSSYFAAEGSARRELIRGSEKLGLLVNASLVLIALAAVVAVGALSYRERRLTTALRRRIEEEEALREVAQALGTAVTREELLGRLALGATATTHSAGAYVECAESEGGAVQLVVHERGSPPSACVRGVRSGSLTELVAARGGAGSLVEVDSVTRWTLPERDAAAASERAGLVTGLRSADRTLGVLVLLRDLDAAPFGEDARRQIQILADLGSAALQRVSVREAERRALAEAERRARQEAALREAAEALAGAYTMEEVTQQIVRTALEATEARGAFVEQITRAAGEPTEVVVRASTGSGVPALGSAVPYAGSCAERAIGAREPVVVADLARDDRGCTARRKLEHGCSAIVVPLAHGEIPLGALFIVSAAGAEFRDDDVTRAHTFGHLAALAYEKVRLLDEAREGRRELERVLKSRSRLMRGFSHDVKNPLGAADGYAALLEEGIYGALSGMQRQKVARLRESIHGALALIDDLHELARAEAGQIPLSLKPVDIADVVRVSADEYRAAAELGGLSLSVDSEPDLPLVETDRDRLRQIVSNLLSNAIKYTPRGSVTLRVRREPAGTGDGEWAVIEVSDTGRGIAEEKRDAIFEEFIRVGSDEKSGAGLGLAISQKLAEALGGRLAVQSEVGSGSTFALRLPLPKSGEPVPS